MNIAEILKDAPKGTKLYSLVCGECTLYKVDNVGRITVFSTQEHYYNFFANGTMDYYGECLLFPSKENRDWSTFNIKPKFKVGDKITRKGYSDCTIKSIYESITYVCENDEGETHIDVKEQEKWDLSQKFKKGDFEKGDFIVNRDGWVGIFECYDSPLRTKSSLLCVLDDNGLFVNNEGPIVWLNIDIKIATEEEKQELLKAIDENGYVWDEEKLDLRKKRKKLKLFPNKYYTAVANCFHDGVCLLKIGHTYKGSDQEGCVVGEEGRLFIDLHDGIASTYLRHATLEEINEFEESRHKTHQFKPFDKVLARDDDFDVWFPADYGFYFEEHKPWAHVLSGGRAVKYVIPYEGNEHLVGASNNPE